MTIGIGLRTEFNIRQSMAALKDPPVRIVQIPGQNLSGQQARKIHATLFRVEPRTRLGCISEHLHFGTHKNL